MPQKVKSALERGKNINIGNNNNQLNILINDCVNVENNVKEINNIYDVIKKCNANKDVKLMIAPENNDINGLIDLIKNFGGIQNNQINIDSKILSKLDMVKIQNWLKDSIREINRYELIYRATVHGDSVGVSFQMCKNKPNLLWLMKDKNNNIFGCFHSIPIYSNDSYCYDTKCFLFSVNKNKKYNPNLQIQKNMYNCTSHLIEFGEEGKNVWEFNIGDKFLSTNSVYFQNGTIFNHQMEICDNNSYASLSELEVFRVI